MKIDVVSIFGDYLDPLRLSLVGKAVETGLIELDVHDLRSWTHDRHRKVDDTPYGGGAGMVMMPEPWGAALDDLVGPPGDSVTTRASGSDPRLIVLTPSGRSFTQVVAHELAAESHLIFACGRYEGIDARVTEHAAGRMRVDELSIGDYVLNGGEAAALVIIEAVVRLIPGVIGNPASLDEESHGLDHDGLLEYPAYTKPASWRGLDVPEVLFSGHHVKIAAWRREQALAKTRERRPELIPSTEVILTDATPADAGELLTLQRAAYLPEGRLHGSFEIPPLTETLVELTAAITSDAFMVAWMGTRIVGSVRGSLLADHQWYVGRLMVAPDQQGTGIGGRLLAAIEARAPQSVSSFRLTTGGNSARNVGFYTRRGYIEVHRDTPPGEVPLLIMNKTPTH